VGSATVYANGPNVRGFAIFRYTPTNGPPSEGTAPLELPAFQTNLILPYDNTAGFVTGVALANASPASTSFAVNTFDEAGHLLGVAENIPIALGGRE
jgi:hypothetical protein